MPTPSPTPASAAIHADYDLILLGGGCAGLSLASHLAVQPDPPRVLIVESRPSYTEDRTWCGWRVAPHLFEDCAIAEWNQWRISDSRDPMQPAHEFIRSSANYPYQMISSIRFYEKALRLIAQTPGINLLSNTAATGLTEERSRVHITLSDGQTVSALWAIDSRPQSRSQSRTLTQAMPHPWLWQNFVGYVLHLSHEQWVRWGDRPTLMDFQPSHDDIVQFLYLIPIADDRYLCEWTRFATTHGQQSEIEADLNAWLTANLDHGAWSIERRESGSLPMSPPYIPSTRTATRIINVGTRGGSMRASTGYAFHAIQRWASACAESIAATRIPIAPVRNPMLNFMDELFLRVLQQPGTDAAAIFQTLFAKAPADPLIRFLTGIPQTADLWPVVRPLPWLRFLQAIPSTLANKQRS